MTKKLFDLTGKVAVVTGASANGGIGHAIALGFAHYGADISVSDIDLDGVKITGKEIEALERKSHVARCDISDPDAVKRLFSEIDETFGRVDILVNVPFVFTSRVRPHKVILEDWEKTLAVNLTGFFLCVQQAIKRMLPQEKGGAILNIGSIAGASGMGRGNFSYSCSKAAVHEMTKELAVEYAGSGIRVNAILPAQVLTPGVRQLLDDPRLKETIEDTVKRGLPMQRMLNPEEFVGPAVFLCSDAASAITGILMPVDGGNLAMNAGGSHTWAADF